MDDNLASKNVRYWQSYKPGEIPSVPVSPPESLLSEINGPILDVGTGDGLLAEELSNRGKEVYAIDIAKNVIEDNLTKKTKVKYSIQNISIKTDFPDGFFDLIMFKFVLTNIHRESWGSLSLELNRILKTGGKVWILEPLVSDSYKERYALAKSFIDDAHCVYVFKEKEVAEKIANKEDLKRAIEADQVSRIIKHYTTEELGTIFDKCSLVQSRMIEVISPSGYPINTFEGVYQKKV